MRPGSGNDLESVKDYKEEFILLEITDTAKDKLQDVLDKSDGKYLRVVLAGVG
jgi:hypothetical protein